MHRDRWCKEMEVVYARLDKSEFVGCKSELIRLKSMYLIDYYHKISIIRLSISLNGGMPTTTKMQIKLIVQILELPNKQWRNYSGRNLVAL
jgi:hypothetical protein